MSDPRYVHLEDRGVLAVAGEDARPFLQGLVSNDVTRVDAGRTVYAALLTAQGKILHDMFILASTDGLLLDCEHERRDDLLRRLGLYKLRSRIEIRDVSDQHRVAAFFGEGALAALGLPDEPGRARAVAGGLVYVDPRSEALGARALLPAARPDAAIAGLGFKAGAFGDYERLRLAIGAPDGSRDMIPGQDFLLECNGDLLNAIDWTKGCYVGQEITARSRYRGTVRKRLAPVTIRGPAPEPGAPIIARADGREIVAGTLRSARDGRGIALLRLDCLDAPLSSGGSEIEARRLG